MENKEIFTIDEWIFHYSQDDEKFKLLFKFLFCLFEKCDKFAFKTGTNLAHKIFEIEKLSVNCKPEKKKMIKFLFQNIFTNSLKRIDFEQTKSIPEKFKPNLHSKDHYLLEIALSTETKTLITTDERLKNQLEKVESELGIKCFLAEEFMKNYIEQFSK